MTVWFGLKILYYSMKALPFSFIDCLKPSCMKWAYPVWFTQISGALNTEFLTCCAQPDQLTFTPGVYIVNLLIYVLLNWKYKCIQLALTSQKVSTFWLKQRHSYFWAQFTLPPDGHNIYRAPPHTFPVLKIYKVWKALWYIITNALTRIHLSVYCIAPNCHNFISPDSPSIDIQGHNNGGKNNHKEHFIK